MKKLNLIILFLMLLPAFMFAQDSEPVVVLEYFDDPDGVYITSADGEDVYPEYGMALEPGDTLKTTTSVAELRLEPNGSLIKLAAKTEFVIDTLQNRGAAEANTFSLVSGKLRAIAARTADSAYQIKTVSAVCGVRGTIFGMEFISGIKDSVIVEKGKIAFQKIASGDVIDLGAGQFADTFASTFEAVAVSAEQIAQFFEGIQDFVGENINPQAVPGNEPGEGDGEGEGDAEGDTEEDGGDEEESADSTPVTPEGDATADAAEESTEPGPLDPIMDYLRDVLGMEIGSITIDGKTYSKAVIQPEFTLGKMRLGLYIPIIYESNMFDPEDWYHPKGNDEWSFGQDYNWDTDPMGTLGDIFGDIFLKVRYLEYGEQRDKFFIKIGNLDNMTIGHGLLMRNYANDANFPAIRRIGLNTGFDLGGIGIETVVNDLTEPEIFGARIYLRPSPEKFPMAFGLSGIVDIDPAGEIAVDPLDTSGIDLALAVGDPMFFNAAFDIDLPIVNKEFLQIIMFGDIGGMMPYFRNAITDGTDTIETGLLIQALYNADADIAAGEIPLRNYGISAGLLGKIFIMDYRLEYRNYRGTFKPAFYGPNYDRLRGQYAVELYTELFNPEEVVPIAGIYGEAGFMIMDKLRFEAGYMWPWESDFTFGEDDYIHLEVELFSGLIPTIDIAGSISYDRTKFIPTLINGDTNGLTLFDANTVVKGELVYPIAPTLDVAILITTTTAHNDEGEVLLDDNGNTKISPSVSIETRIDF